jgi:peptidoglycan/xylan/chitin deacetylase (PgdA/CDA1 family)
MKLIAFLFAALLSLSSFAQERTIPVLMYHQITTPPSRENIALDTFKAQLAWLKEEGYTTVTISQLADHMAGRTTLPAKTVALTFDDGWRTTLDAVTWLQYHDMSATFFIISGMLSHPLYLNPSEVKLLAKNPRFEIGAHSHTHLMQWVDDLTKVDTRIAVGELVMSKRLIEELINQPVKTYAWPFGYVRSEFLDFAVGAGFTSSVHVNSVSDNVKGTWPMDIRRVNIDGRCSLERFKSMVTTGRLERCDEEAIGVDQRTVR